ncbi:LysR family transcriptional regulator [Modestobacter sp. VKM Ac-2978]|uniref:LysR family transcriptional regulator n=1 Tax=Modestobacter sp. VKM Ac-2978 TaxID=3004132 RepID=UPI0022AB3A7A|nr:LysR family transcriptional regulator [Modestobacter sp. VKM Ac-2978]MCZ2846389.1 LysR family transcriptional regulator [Modestobacter sp. VKM Ac-2978]
MVIDIPPSHLRALVAVADAGGFTAAAAQLGTAQSSLSRAVADVERRLRVRVFERTTRSLRLTSQGREIIALSRQVLADLDAGMRHLEGYLAGQRGRVTIACLPSVAATLLPPVVVAFRARFPDVQVQVRDGLAADVLDAVHSGSVDLAVTAAPAPLARLTVEQLRLDPFSCAFAPGHRFAGRAEVDWAELTDEPFITFGADSSIRGPVDLALRAAGATPGPVLEARNVGAVAGLTAAALGVTAVPQLVLPMMAFAGVQHAPLRPAVERRISLVRAPERPLTPSAEAFARELHSMSES